MNIYLIEQICIYTGVDNVDIDMFMQKVTVAGWADPKKKYSRV